MAYDSTESAGKSPPGQFWVNLGVWFAAFEPAGLRARRVVYEPRESRENGKWGVAAPKRCWACGEQGELSNRKAERDIRAFDPPWGLLALALFGFVLLSALSVYFNNVPLVVFALLCVVGGVLAVLMKSGVEPVRTVVWCCPRHMAPPEIPLAIHDNQLVVYWPNRDLASEAAEELKTQRRTRKNIHGDQADDPLVRQPARRAAETADAIPLDDVPSSAASHDAPPRNRPRPSQAEEKPAGNGPPPRKPASNDSAAAPPAHRAPLPPIKFDDD